MVYEIKNGLVIGTTPALSSPSAQVQFDSTEQGTLLQRMTTAQKNAIVSPATGLLVFDTDLGSFSHWNGSFWVGLPLVKEEFLGNANGEVLMFAGATANSGGAVTGTSLSNAADLNGSDTKARSGISSISSGTAANGFSILVNSNLIANTRYALSLKSKIYLGLIWAQTTEPTVNFANNPVLACAGLLAYTATSTVNPLNGIYHRLPRTGETAFVKYVVREGGVESVFDTAIPFTSNLSGYLKTALLWDGANDTMYFITGANGVYDTKFITTFSVSHAAAFAAAYHWGAHTIRNGSGAANNNVTIVTDEAERHLFANYLDYV